MAVTRMLFFLGTVFFVFTEIRTAPTKYDQRQDGDFNLYGQIDNLLLVAIIPSRNNYQLLNNIAEGFESGLHQMVSQSKEQGLIGSSEEVHQGESPSVEIVQINENPDKESSVQKAEGDTGTSNVSDQQPTSIGDGQTEKAERVARNVKNFEFPKSREVPAIPGYFVDVRKTLRPKAGDERARNVVGNVWHLDVVEPGRPGTSLKKQLPRRGEEGVALSSLNADKNDVPSFAEEKQQELRLLGDSIENCGPGRRRDPSGVCQFDESAGSLL